jgi:hypothetical protein
MSQRQSEDFTTFDVCRILNLKRDRLKDWIERGFIVPAAQEDVARGKKSYFDKWGLYMIKLFHHVVTNGIAREQAAKWIKELTEYKDQQSELDPLDSNFLMIKRIQTEVVEQSITWGPSKVIDSSEDIDDAYIVNFKKIRQAVDSALED